MLSKYVFLEFLQQAFFLEQNFFFKDLDGQRMCGEKVDIEIAKGPGNKARDRRGDGRPVVRDSRREREASRRSRSYDRRSRSRDRRVKNLNKNENQKQLHLIMSSRTYVQ